VRIIQHIKQWIWSRALNNRLAGRERLRESGSLLTAKDVLVLYDASEEFQNKLAEEFFAELKKLDIRVKSIGYAKFKIVPHYCIPQLTRLFICKKHLDLTGIPKHPFLDDFLDEPFDLLISMDQEQDPVLQFLAAASMARYKVGWNHPGNLPWFDLLVGGTEPDDPKGFLHQIVHYLSINNT